ncbi:MAG: fasciclin domain-containing protein [Bacteroidota bacterium]
MRIRTLLLALLAFPLAASAQHTPDIVEIAAGSDDFETLVAAVSAAGLVETLQGDGPFTVFAPKDAAFARLGDDTIESLLRPENRDQLTAILTYHVVPGRFSSAELGAIDELTTVNGQTLRIGNRINRSRLVATDIEASNGIVHVIDRVLMPETRRSRSSASHH